jgi:hypothetical protein
MAEVTYTPCADTKHGVATNGVSQINLPTGLSCTVCVVVATRIYHLTRAHRTDRE